MLKNYPIMDLNQKQEKQLKFMNGDEGNRTPGLGIANAALSQLSYIPINN